MATDEKVLKRVSLTRITNSGLRIFIEEQITAIEAIGPALTDPGLIAQLAFLKSLLAEYGQSILKVQKSAYTKKMIVFDVTRDKALKGYYHALRGFSFSEDLEELAAHDKLTTLSAVYKGLDAFDYEEQTDRTSGMVAELESPTFSSAVATLVMGKHVTRVKTTNLDFKVLFGSRNAESAAKEVYDVMALRKKLEKRYKQFADYSLSMANAMDAEPFNSILRIINTSRSYYDELIRRRQGIRDAADEETETPAL